jgi:hypothetical protein
MAAVIRSVRLHSDCSQNLRAGFAAKNYNGLKARFEQMKPEIAKRLNAILDTRQKQNQQASAGATEKQKRQARNLDDFNAKSESVIKPALQEIVQLYKAKGVTIYLQESNETLGRVGIVFPTISLDMRGQYGRHDPKPEFRFRFDKGDRTLSLYTSTGRQSGPAGTVSLDDITAEWIHEAFAKYQSGSRH